MALWNCWPMPIIGHWDIELKCDCASVHLVSASVGTEERARLAKRVWCTGRGPDGRKAVFSPGRHVELCSDCAPKIDGTRASWNRSCDGCRDALLLPDLALAATPSWPGPSVPQGF